MTTILAGANWTMWPGIDEDDGRQTDSLVFRREHVREAYHINVTTQPIREHEPISEGWLGVWVKAPSSSTVGIEGYTIELLDNNDNTLLGIYRNDSGEGDAAVNAPFLSEPVVALEYDTEAGEISVSFKLDASDGYLKVFARGVEVFSFDGDTVGSNLNEAVKTRMSRVTSSVQDARAIKLSEILLSTEPTIGFKVVDTELSVASLSQWDGTPSNITPIGYASTEDSLSTDAADQLVTFSRPNIPALDGDEFVASVHFETSQLAESGATASEADLLVYDGSEHGAERVQPGTSFEEFRAQWDQDPRTNAPWTEAGVNEIEVGVASRTA